MHAMFELGECPIRDDVRISSTPIIDRKGSDSEGVHKIDQHQGARLPALLESKTPCESATY